MTTSLNIERRRPAVRRTATVTRCAGLRTSPAVPSRLGEENDGDRPLIRSPPASTMRKQPARASTRRHGCAGTEVLTATQPDGLISDERAALRRLATLVSQAAPSEDVFTAVASEAGRLLGADFALVSRYQPDGAATVVGTWAGTGPVPIAQGARLEGGGLSVHSLVFRSGRPARIDDYGDGPGQGADIARDWGVRSVVGVPVSLDGRLWGQIGVASRCELLPPDTETWLAGFTELVAAAIANTAAREELKGYAEEQAALRRVATLVATETSPAQVFATVAAEIGRVLAVDVTVMGRYDPDGSATVLGTWANTGVAVPVLAAGRVEVGGQNVTTRVFETGRTVRRDSYADASGAAADVARGWGLRSMVGAPITVEGRLWGVVIVAYTHEKPLPAGTEARLGGFTELVATAIANAQARVELRGFGEEQAALRRVATLVAGAAPPDDVFAAVAAEAGELLNVDVTALIRYELDGALAVGGWAKTDPGRPLAVGTRLTLGGLNVYTLVFQTGRPARLDDYREASGSAAHLARDWGFRSAVGAPISVGDRLWGVIIVASVREEPLPPDTERRLAGFTELVATAIANAEAEERLRLLADTQAALRRLAMLVAQGEPPEVVFIAVTKEVLRHFGGGTARMIRYEPDGGATLIANEGTSGPHVRLGMRWEGYPANGLTETVRRTGRPARVDDYDGVPGGEPYLREGLRSAVGMPILVNGRLWGMIAVGSGQGALPAGVEQRMMEFTDLVGTAIANAQSRAELMSSRARVVAAFDEARRRIERDLHDGAQQSLVALGLKLRSAAVGPLDSEETRREFTEAADGLMRLNDELREMSRGIHPAILSEAGLRPALGSLGRRMSIPVDLDVRVDERLPEPVEVAAYYFVSEMLTNAVKHARASTVQVAADVADGLLRIRVCDDGVGGADPTRGTGLVGLKDRVEAIGGTFAVHSPRGRGTTVRCGLPCAVVREPEPPSSTSLL